ncbi:MAG: hypothetical protein RIT45_4077 [Pseudomonadota bacterium]
MAEATTASELIIRVQGMTCGGCARSVKAAIEAAVPGATAHVRLQDAEVDVSGTTDSATLEQAVLDAGFDYAGVRET